MVSPLVSPVDRPRLDPKVWAVPLVWPVPELELLFPGPPLVVPKEWPSVVEEPLLMLLPCVIPDVVVVEVPLLVLRRYLMTFPMTREAYSFVSGQLLAW